MSVCEISCSLQRRLRAMPYLFQSHIPEQLRLRVFNCCNVMWKAYGSFTPSDRGDDGLCRTIGEFQYINQLKFSQKSVLIKPIRLLEFSRAKFLLIESTGCKKTILRIEGVEGVSRMQVICCPEVNKKTSAIFLNLERYRRSKVWIGGITKKPTFRTASFIPERQSI